MIGDVVVEVDSGVADASLARARWLYIRAIVGQLIASVGLIIWLLSSNVMSPLRRLREEALELARRKLAKPFIWNRPDELGDLGASLESTSCELILLFDKIEVKNRQLEAQIIELESRVMEHTIALQRERDSVDHAHRNIFPPSEIGREITSTFGRQKE